MNLLALALQLWLWLGGSGSGCNSNRVISGFGLGYIRFWSYNSNMLGGPIGSPINMPMSNPHARWINRIPNQHARSHLFQVLVSNSNMLGGPIGSPINMPMSNPHARWINRIPNQHVRSHLFRTPLRFLAIWSITWVGTPLRFLATWSKTHPKSSPKITSNKFEIIPIPCLRKFKPQKTLTRKPIPILVLFFKALNNISVI